MKKNKRLEEQMCLLLEELEKAKKKEEPSEDYSLRDQMGELGEIVE